MTVLEKIKRCVSLVWDFQEIYDEEDIEDFCRNELHTYPQHDEIMEYFKHIENLEKANEWHYVKDGDLPPLDTNVLVIHRWAKIPEVGKRIKVFINSSVWVWAMCSDRFRYTSDDENVIAWKEIVLPKESK